MNAISFTCLLQIYLYFCGSVYQLDFVCPCIDLFLSKNVCLLELAKVQIQSCYHNYCSQSEKKCKKLQKPLSSCRLEMGSNPIALPAVESVPFTASQMHGFREAIKIYSMCWERLSSQ